jgi:diguanylate cyclase (GGDEF)-like protein
MTSTVPSVSPADEHVASALDALVQRGPLSVAFQPIVDLERCELVGYEVLGRCAPVAGPLAAAAARPDLLLNVAERHGRLLSLDRRWRELAMQAITACGDRGSLFFLNVDPRIVDDPSYTSGFTLALVERHGLAPERFVLELTEVASRDPAAIERVLAHYARQGFRVALDDLGAGQQSLLTLLRVQPQIVKLDRELVRRADVDASRAHLLGALAEFARRAGILLVGEGIETRGELDAVCRAGAAYGQGFLLGRPAPRPEPLGAEARELLRATIRSAAPRASMAYGVRDPSLPLLELVGGLRDAESLETMLQQVTDTAASVLGVSRMSLRLLDAERARLLVAARTGTPVHGRSGADFAVGEGFAGWVVQHRAPLRVDHAESDPRFVRKPGMLAPIGSFLGTPLLDDEGCIGVLATTQPSRGGFSALDERWLRVVAGAAAPYLAVARLKRLAVTDPLTSALNRRALEDLFEDREEIVVEPKSVLAIDIDRFKVVNDRLGHAAGDEVLRTVVRIMARVIRQRDRLVRLGGEEFLIVLPGASLHAARITAERVREAVGCAELVPGAQVTLSIGVAERARGEAREALLGRADEALYHAKRLGRDRVIAHDGPLLPLLP